ncbi:MAG: 3-hydroxyacyl-CoA dehydrogenase family protein [Acidobacteria bacterium]|nr:3-hydroxyacyl-CoA dehydrogenase family protein [Acidobacteriota bacterium]
MEKISVIGAGLMGHGIAQVFAVKGYDVAIHDPFPDALASVPERVRANLRSLGYDESCVEKISLHSTLKSAVEEADIVFEAAPENIALKQDLFEQMSTATPAGCILASNTSVIPIGQVAARAENPGRVLGTHWWNPPYLIPLVEVIQAPCTDLIHIEQCMGLLQRAGKTAVHVKRDVPGFVGNRLQHALWREAISIVEAGICDAETVDLVVKNSFGMRLPILGPLENADLVGLDLTLAIHNVILRHLEASPEPSPLLELYANQQRLGMKTGKGFMEWTPESAQQVRDRLTRYLSDAIHRGESFRDGAVKNKI